MTKTFEEVSAIWAQRKLPDLTVNQISKVEFDIDVDTSPGCPTCGHGGGETTLEAYVRLKPGSTKKKGDPATRSIYLSRYDLPELLEELVDIANESA